MGNHTLWASICCIILLHYLFVCSIYWRVFGLFKRHVGLQYFVLYICVVLTIHSSPLSYIEDSLI